MDKEVVVHTFNGVLLSHKRNASESVLVRRINLGPQVKSQEEKSKFCVLTHIYRI